MLQSVVVLIRVIFAAFLGFAGVICSALGLYFMVGLHAKLIGGGALLVVAFFLFAVASFTAARNILVATLRVQDSERHTRAASGRLRIV